MGKPDPGRLYRLSACSEALVPLGQDAWCCIVFFRHNNGRRRAEHSARNRFNSYRLLTPPAPQNSFCRRGGTPTPRLCAPPKPRPHRAASGPHPSRQELRGDVSGVAVKLSSAAPAPSPCPLLSYFCFFKPSPRRCLPPFTSLSLTLCALSPLSGSFTAQSVIN